MVALLQPMRVLRDVNPMNFPSLRRILSTTTAIAMVGFLPIVASAQSGFLQGGLLNQTAGRTGVPTASADQLPVIIGNVINALLSVLGFVLLFFMLYAGFLWMTAQGDAKQVDKAKGMIRDAIIGLTIIALSFALTSFVLNALVNAVPTTSGGGTVAPGTPGR